MKLQELLLERVERIPNGAKIIANPGSQQFAVIMNRNIERFKRGDKNSDEALLKGILDKKNNIFWIWNGFDAIHNQVADFLSDAYGTGRINYDDEEKGDLIPMIVAYVYDRIDFWAPVESFWNHPAVAAATRNIKAQYEQQNF